MIKSIKRPIASIFNDITRSYEPLKVASRQIFEVKDYSYSVVRMVPWKKELDSRNLFQEGALTTPV